MLPGIAADVVVVIHFAFIIFGVFGALLAFRWRWIPWVHLPAVVWGAFVEVSGRACPLTPLEKAFRRAAGEAGYTGDFVDRYIAAVIYPDGLTRAMQVLLAVALVAVNVGIYGTLWWMRSRKDVAR